MMPALRFQLREKGLTFSIVHLSTDSPSLRLQLQQVTNVLEKQLYIIEVSSEIATTIDESLSKQQKALFLRQQLATINAELQRLSNQGVNLHSTGNGQEDEDELELLIRRVDSPRGQRSTAHCFLRGSPPQTGPSSKRRARCRTKFRASIHIFLVTLNPDSASPARMAHFAGLDSHYGLEKVKRGVSRCRPAPRLDRTRGRSRTGQGAGSYA